MLFYKKRGHGLGRNLCAERLDMKPDGRLAVRKRRIVTVALTDHDAFQAKRISDESVRMFFNNDLHGFHSRKLPLHPGR